jgi:diadenosine tetraphosphatase ApaH/serine/threonine PP2A family protein phosphatase
MLEEVQNKEEYYNFILKYLSKTVESEFIYNYMGGYNCYEDHKDFIDRYNKTTQEYLIDGVVYNTNDLFENVNFEGMTCFEPSQQTFINGDGNVFVCSSAVPSTIAKGDIWFNILTDKNFLVKFKVTHKYGYKCKWTQCLGCFYSDKIRKES